MKHVLLKSLPRPEQEYMIYVLIDPDTKEIQYVGQTIRGFKRIREHYSKGYLGSSRVNRFVKRLKKQNKIFDVEYLEYCDSFEKLFEAEQFYISYFKFIGIDLLNHNLQPLDLYIPRPLSVQTRLMISERTRLAMKQPDVYKNLIESHKGLPSSNKGNKYSKEIKIKISQGTENKIRYVEDDLGNIFRGSQVCADFWKLNRSGIQHVLKGRCEENYGRKFKYLDATDKEFDEKIKRVIKYGDY